jgi:hypothetical protein
MEIQKLVTKIGVLFTAAKLDVESRAARFSNQKS